MPKRIYLAGPEVFLPDPRTTATRKKAICRGHGFDASFPLDAETDLTGLSPREAGLAISRANEALMRQSDILIANMTPFRGPSMDVGTAYEMGVMRGLGRPVLGYCNVSAPFKQRAVAQCSGRKTPSGWVDAHGMTIEDFDLVDNLMLDGAVAGSGVQIVVHQATNGALFTDLTAFDACVRMARETHA